MPGLYNRRLFQMAEGGMVPPDSLELMRPDEEAQIYQEAQNLPPEVLQMANQELGAVAQEVASDEIPNAIGQEVSRSIGNLETAGDFQDVMNAVWDDAADIGSYRNRLAAIVGPEDAQRTPDSVLALVQPTLQLAEMDTGIGALMQAELEEVGGMGGGITELSAKGAVADGMASETGALVSAVGRMSQGPGPMDQAPPGAGIMGLDQGAAGMDPMMLQAMMQGAGPTGQGMV